MRNTIVLAGSLLFVLLFSPLVHAEEGTVLSERMSCDPFGIPRHDQLVQFEARKAEYVKTHPDAGFVLGLESPSRKIFRDKFWFRGMFADRVELNAAGNEMEAFQLCVVPLGYESVKVMKITPTALNGPDGAVIDAKNIRIWQVAYLKTSRPSYPTIHVGWWPDPLLPFKSMVIRGTELQPYWVRVAVPADAKPGEYTGTIKVETQVSGERDCTIRLKVRKFKLPKEPLLIFHAWYFGLNVYKNYYNYKTNDEAVKMALRYANELIRDYRLFPIDVAKYAHRLYGKDKDWERFDAFFQPFVDKGMRLTQMPGVQIPGLKGGMKKEAFIRLCDHLREKGWLKYSYVYAWCDEPYASVYPKLREYAKAVKAIVPDAKILTAESPTPELAGFSDAYWSDISTENPEYNQERRKAGDKVLWYFCRIPVGMDRNYRSIWDAPLMLIDRRAVEQRVAFWLAWKYRMDGIMIWAGNRSWYEKGKTTWPARGGEWNPYIDSYGKNNPHFGGADNGNGVLFYPTRRGMAPSIQLENLREGYEEYAYLWMLNELRKKNAGKKPIPRVEFSPTVAVTTTMFTKDPEAFVKERERIAAEIEKLNP